VLADVPRRKNFGEGDAGRQAWKAAFNKKAGDFAHSHVQAETVKNRMGAVGMWGDYCEREGMEVAAAPCTPCTLFMPRSIGWPCMYAPGVGGRLMPALYECTWCDDGVYEARGENDGWCIMGE
jgi:hypothetical protein